MGSSFMVAGNAIHDALGAITYQVSNGVTRSFEELPAKDSLKIAVIDAMEDVEIE